MKTFICLLVLIFSSNFEYEEYFIGRELQIKDFGEIEFFEIGDFKIKNEKIFLTDTKGQKVYKFSLKGELLKATGRSGRGPGEFEYGPRSLVATENHVFVNSTAPWLHVYDSDLNFIEFREVTESALSMTGMVEANGLIYLTPTQFLEENVFIYNPVTNEEEGIKLKFKLEPGLLSKYTIHQMGNKWLFTWHFKNEFKVFDSEFNELNSFKLEGVPDRAQGTIDIIKNIPKEATSYRAEMYKLGTFTPMGTIFSSFVKLNDNHLLIQLGTDGGFDNALVIDLKGDVLQKIKLPSKQLVLLEYSNEILYVKNRRTEKITAFEFKTSD